MVDWGFEAGVGAFEGELAQTELHVKYAVFIW